MDFSTLLKGATDSLKKLDAKPDAAKPSWQPWEVTEDDGWEDVTDIASDAIASTPEQPSATTDASATATATATATASAAAEPYVANPSHAKPGSALSLNSLEGTPTKATGNDPSAASAISGTPATESTAVSDATTGSHMESSSGMQHAAISTSEAQANRLSPTFAKERADEIATLTQQLRTALDRASASERKVIALTRAREARTHDTTHQEAQLKAMREEGEKLSVRIAEKESAVRTLRTTVKERDAALEDAAATISATEAKVEANGSRIRQLETAERAANDAREAAERRLREVEADARGKSTSNAALEAARSQLESLRKNHTSALENQAMRLDAEKEAAVHAVETKAESREEALNSSMVELRTHLSQVVDNAGWREDQLRRENDELRLRAEQLEARNEELAAALPNATRPLIRQVEALQAAAEERERAKQAVDRSYMERLRTAETSAAAARERERAAEDRVSNVLTKCATLEEQLRLSQADTARAVTDAHRLQADAADREAKSRADVDDSLARAGRAERERDAARSEVADARTGYMDALEAAEVREKSLRAQLATAETKVAMMMERDARTRAADGARTDGVAGGYTADGASSGNGSGSGGLMTDARAAALADGSEDVSEEGRLVDGDGSTVAGVYATQRLSSSLRLRNGEVASLQAQLDLKEKATRALAEEVVNLTARLEQVTKEKAQSPDVSRKFDELEGRHGTLLELLGEREEHIGELEADLNDVKAMYKDQVTELLLRIERLST